MIKRTAEKTLKRLSAQFPVIGITGSRQSGKSTLAKMVFSEKNIFHSTTKLCVNSLLLIQRILLWLFLKGQL